MVIAEKGRDNPRSESLVLLRFISAMPSPSWTGLKLYGTAVKCNCRELPRERGREAKSCIGPGSSVFGRNSQKRESNKDLTVITVVLGAPSRPTILWVDFFGRLEPSVDEPLRTVRNRPAAVPAKTR